MFEQGGLALPFPNNGKNRIGISIFTSLWLSQQRSLSNLAPSSVIPSNHSTQFDNTPGLPAKACPCDIFRKGSSRFKHVSNAHHPRLSIGPPNHGSEKRNYVLFKQRIYKTNCSRLVRNVLIGETKVTLSRW